jgi:hypothetical protein
MEINWCKTKAMILTTARRNRAEFPKTINLYNEVEVVDEFKLLGVIVDSKLEFSKQILNIKKLITKKLYIIKNLLIITIQT